MDAKSQAHPPVIRLLIATHHRLDGEMLCAQFHAHADFCVECATTDIQVAAATCRECRPDVVLLDANLATHDSSHDVPALVDSFGDVSVLLLDEEMCDGRLAAVLESSTVGYFTRAASFAELVDGVRKLARGVRVFCSRVQSRLERTSAGWRLRCDSPASPLAKLTRRELEIARLVAGGNSVRDCAAALHLSPNTVDNHKSRLMKKLGLHKALELTRLAVREGLIRL